ncbi:hypothetical protein LAZ67_X000706 [Cordylochernes scorpioides]|uniref:Transposase n=1 Tax=Cordylochernes scorpioides TaxID=51811 RepID=A0ABY6LUZ3_9ARAC|nr:hypothetical protein LAZ67_X000706 [Cordylochernes scorpioides]
MPSGYSRAKIPKPPLLLKPTEKSGGEESGMTCTEKVSGRSLWPSGQNAPLRADTLQRSKGGATTLWNELKRIIGYREEHGLTKEFLRSPQTIARI